MAKAGFTSLPLGHKPKFQKHVLHPMFTELNRLMGYLLYIQPYARYYKKNGDIK